MNTQTRKLKTIIAQFGAGKTTFCQKNDGCIDADNLDEIQNVYAIMRLLKFGAFAPLGQQQQQTETTHEQATNMNKQNEITSLTGSIVTESLGHGKTQPDPTIHAFNTARVSSSLNEDTLKMVRQTYRRYRQLHNVIGLIEKLKLIVPIGIRAELHQARVTLSTFTRVATEVEVASPDVVKIHCAQDIAELGGAQ